MPWLLLVAVALALVVMAVPLPHRRLTTPTPAAAAELTVAQTWPKARQVEVPGVVGGEAFTPQAFAGVSTVVGTVDSDTQTKLVVLASGAAPREIRTLPASTRPGFGPVVIAEGQIVWTETARVVTEIWSAPLTAGGPARRITRDTGQVIFFNSQYDLQVVNGQVIWAAAGRQPVTEVRSVPLAGGAVLVRRMPGAFALTAWPWLVSASSGQTGPVSLVNVESGARRSAPASAAELATCSPVWCRILVLASGAPARLDLIRVDGSNRRRIAGGTASAAVMDVALLDRFEVLTAAGVSGTQRVTLYDAAYDRAALLSDAATNVMSRNGYLWWSAASQANPRWYVRDLRTLG